MRRLLAYLIALFAFMACASQLENDFSGRMDPSLEGKPVTITFSVPDVRDVSLTKAVGDINADPYLDPDKLYLVVCGSSQSIKYIRKAEVLRDDNDKIITEKVDVSAVEDYPFEKKGGEKVTMYKFKVQLELTDKITTVHFLGNIDENQLVTGSYSYQILPTLLSLEGKQAYWQKVTMASVHPKYENGQPVMQGNSYLPDIATAKSLEHVSLIRNYAKIIVTDATSSDDEFELYSYAVIHFPKQGSVTPYRSNVDVLTEDPFGFNIHGDSYRFSSYERCSFTDLDEELEYPGYLSPKVKFDTEIPSESEFENPDGIRVIKYDENKPDQGFYVYERSIPNDKLKPTFVILRGKFGGEGEYYYYRLDLMETKTVNNESVSEYYPIYRNFRYNIQLNRISSIGVSTPEAAANSSGAEDISADISMKHLSDISNGQTRLVVEPFMAKTYTGPNEEGYYYIYARFYNDLNSPEPNVDWGAVSVELEPLEDQSEDILVLYDDVGNEVHSFYPAAQSMGEETGFRIVRFNTKAAGSETKTQKIKITGRNLYTHEEFPLYREVEITLQKKQTMTVTCAIPEVPLQKDASQVVNVTIPADLPSSMFPLEFTIEAERLTLTPDNRVSNNNLPVHSGISISDNEEYAGKTTIQYIRTLTEDEYQGLPVTDGTVTFSSYFKSNTSVSATTIWVANDYFIKGHASFDNVEGLIGHFYVQADNDYVDGCNVVINLDNLEYNYEETGWVKYTKSSEIKIGKGHRVAFRSTTTTKGLGSNSGDKFYCYSPGSEMTAKDGRFSIGGNIASLLVGDNFDALGSVLTDWSFQFCFTKHEFLTDASELILPMLECPTNGYKSMFNGCTGLTGAPQLPATTLASSCYANMFDGCTSLTTVPDLPATTLAVSCYYRMFAGCTSLSTSSKPIFLPASTLVTTCYKEMFNGASGVNEVICLATDHSAGNCTTDWLKAVAASGTFWAPSGVTWVHNKPSGIPEGWTRKNYAIPIFPEDPPFDGEIDL